MSSVSTYLNFEGNTEEAFNFYKEVFGGEFSGNGIMRFKDIPADPNNPPCPEGEANYVMHVELKILGSHVLMATDTPSAMGKLNFGNNMSINLQPDTLKETRELYEKLSAGGKVQMELQLMFWGDHFASLTDKFGVQWMFNCNEKQANV